MLKSLKRQSSLGLSAVCQANGACWRYCEQRLAVEHALDFFYLGNPFDYIALLSPHPAY